QSVSPTTHTYTHTHLHPISMPVSVTPPPLCKCSEGKNSPQGLVTPHVCVWCSVCVCVCVCVCVTHLLCVGLLHLCRNLLLVVALGRLLLQFLQLLLQVAALRRQLTHLLLHVDQALITHTHCNVALKAAARSSGQRL